MIIFIFICIKSKEWDVKFGIKYLQWHIWIKCKDRKLFSPEQELFSFCINIVVKYSALGWKLDSLELSDPPLGEFHTVVNGLYKQQHELHHRHPEYSSEQVNALPCLREIIIEH
jgi:hypothetical protein